MQNLRNRVIQPQNNFVLANFEKTSRSQRLGIRMPGFRVGASFLVRYLAKGNVNWEKLTVLSKWVPERSLSGDYHLLLRRTGSRDGKVGRRYWSQLLLFSTFYPAQPTAASENDGDAGDGEIEPAKPQLTSIPHSRANSWLELMTNS